MKFKREFYLKEHSPITDFYSCINDYFENILNISFSKAMIKTNLLRFNNAQFINYMKYACLFISKF